MTKRRLCISQKYFNCINWCQIASEKMCPLISFFRPLEGEGEGEGVRGVKVSSQDYSKLLTTIVSDRA